MTTIDEDLPPIQRLTRDLANASVTLSATEARFLTDAYYQMQDNRIRSAGQIRSMTETNEPHLVLSWLEDQATMLENQIKRALEKYVDNHPVGVWMKSIYGIGPVISAGMLAHIDIKKAPTVGNIWRFAGLDPTVQWRSSEYMRGFIKASREKVNGDNWAALVHICLENNKRPLSVLKAAEMIDVIPEPEQIRTYLRQRDVDRVLKAEYHADNMLKEALGDEALPAAYKELCGDVKFDWKKITRTMTRRPWNADLKVLCWKAGQSFMKFHKKEECFYGHLYIEKKQQILAQNEQGHFADRSKEILAAMRYGTDTEAYKSYIAGRLPPAHVDASARRYAVKIFLAHLHEQMHRRILGKEPPLPYVIAHMGHAHYIAPPEPEEGEGNESL